MTQLRTSRYGLLCLLLVFCLARGAASTSYYELRFELYSTSDWTEVEIEGASIFIDWWALPSPVADLTVTAGCPTFRFEKPCCVEAPATVVFNVLVSPAGTGDLTFWVGKGEIGTTKLTVYAMTEEGEAIQLTSFDVMEGSGSEAQPVRFHLSSEDTYAEAAVSSFNLDLTSSSYRDREEVRDLVYASVPGVEPEFLSLDLYLPPRDLQDPPPLVVWIHGGGWMFGDKSDHNLGGPLGDRYATASINYRLAPEATFPAPLHDCKAAIRWLRAHATEYGYDPERIVVWGASAGGHLAAMVGMTHGVGGLEGDLGEHTDQPSTVSAICGYYGPADLLTVAGQATPGSQQFLMDVFVTGLLGDPVEEVEDLAILASPITHATPDDAPTFLLHGDADPLVPVEQSIVLHDILTQAGVRSVLWIERQGDHGGVTGKQMDAYEAIRTFLDEILGLD